jgi:hypothetical protein
VNITIPQPGTPNYEYNLNFRLAQILQEINRKLTQLEGGKWNGYHPILNGYHLWVDATGALRIKNGAPTSDLDGTSLAGGGTGTVTSVGLSGGTTGITASGSPVTTSGTITLGGTLAVANGGTGQTSYTDGQLLIGNTSTGGLSKATLTAGSNVTITNAGGAITVAASSGGITLGTPQNSTSGTAIDFTGIPSGTKRIIVSFQGVSTTGSNRVMVQLGTSSGVETTGYNGASSYFSVSTLNTINISSGFEVNGGGNADARNGVFTITLLNQSSNLWACSAVLGNQGGNTTTFLIGGSKSLASTIDRVRVTSVGATDTFDAGSINIQYQ